MRIIYYYQGEENVFEGTEVLIGRPKPGAPVDVDLTPDIRVSRPHARIWREDEVYWIEDLNSKWGTLVNGEEIKGQGKRRLQSEDIIKISEAVLKMEIPVEESESDASLNLEMVSSSLDSNEPAFSSNDVLLTDSERKLALFYELPLKFGEATHFDNLLQLIIEQVVDVIPGAQRGVLLIKERTNGALLLKGHFPLGNPVFSATLARQAMEQRRAFIWPPPTEIPEGEMTVSQRALASLRQHEIESTMYAPLLWKGEAFRAPLLSASESLGVLCVDNWETSAAFGNDDLRLLQAVAHHAALAVLNLQLQEDLRRENRVLNKFLKLVSPRVADRLRNHSEQVHLGGEFHEATILFSDIRGFVKLSARMEVDGVTEMLEDYFSRLVPIIFEHHGTIDKFVGDAIVAVFGSPQEDEKQHFHAVLAASEMQIAMREVNARRNALGQCIGELGIGIHSGEVVHGFIGARERMEYTVIGDSVNRASRYCDGALGGEVLISPEVYQWVFNSVDVERTSIATKHEGDMIAYSLKAIKQKSPSGQK